MPGIGPADAKIMLVGEASGESEDLEGVPFVGRAGKLLDSILVGAKISRSDCYITNVVKCRPTTKTGKRVSNRAPTPEEIQACKTWLWKELRLVKPTVVLTLGKVPTGTLLPSLKKSFLMGSVVGNAYSVPYMEAKVIPAWHPSYLLQHGRDKEQETRELFKRVANGDI